MALLGWKLPSWQSLIPWRRTSAADRAAQDKFLHDRATTFHLLSQTDADRGYWFGYCLGIRRRMAGGAKTNYIEAETYRDMLKREDRWKKALARGYRDGLRGKPFVAGEG